MTMIIIANIIIRSKQVGSFHEMLDSLLNTFIMETCNFYQVSLTLIYLE